MADSIAEGFNRITDMMIANKERQRAHEARMQELQLQQMQVQDAIQEREYWKPIKEVERQKAIEKLTPQTIHINEIGHKFHSPEEQETWLNAISPDQPVAFNDEGVLINTETEEPYTMVGMKKAPRMAGASGLIYAKRDPLDKVQRSHATVVEQIDALQKQINSKNFKQPEQRFNPKLKGKLRLQLSDLKAKRDKFEAVMNNKDAVANLYYEYARDLQRAAFEQMAREGGDTEFANIFKQAAQSAMSTGDLYQAGYTREQQHELKAAALEQDATEFERTMRFKEKQAEVLATQEDWRLGLDEQAQADLMWYRREQLKQTEKEAAEEAAAEAASTASERQPGDLTHAQLLNDIEDSNKITGTQGEFRNPEVMPKITTEKAIVNSLINEGLSPKQASVELQKLRLLESEYWQTYNSIQNMGGRSSKKQKAINNLNKDFRDTITDMYGDNITTYTPNPGTRKSLYKGF